jgi:hypothetical protein
MSYLQEQIDIEDFFKLAWTENPAVYENGLSLEDPEWVRLTVLNGNAKQVTMGDDPAFRHYGLVVIQIFTKPNIGAGRAKQLADLIDVMFRNALISNLRFGVPQIMRGPSSPDWYQLNVSIAFYRGF